MPVLVVRPDVRLLRWIKKRLTAGKYSDII